ncbi:isoprenylcysteine carboxylmethyltransferase family protein [Candidatus Woesearchaeota archaeon]|nr:isoprenylcysteine carboxylmethyltransferase family protein [Candidatus Woesearchaeota archaeon]
MKIRIYPPIIAGIYLLVTIILNYIFPGMRIIYSPYHYFGGVFVVAGFILMIWASQVFRKNETTHNPFNKSTVLVTAGPFSFSRNPMYLGLSFILLGIAVFMGTVSLLFAPVAFFLTINMTFVQHEEKKLDRIFGQSYIKYKNRVRRWL